MLVKLLAPLLLGTSFVTATLAYNDRLLGVAGGLVILIGIFLPALLHGFDRLAPILRTYYLRGYPAVMIVGASLIAAGNPSWLAVMALAAAAPAAGALFAAEFEHSTHGRRVTHGETTPSIFFAACAGFALCGVIGLTSARVMDEPASDASPSHLLIARCIATGGALVVCCAVWWGFATAATATLDDEIANAVAVLQSCTSADLALAATKMRVWCDGPLFRATEKVVTMMQHAVSSSSGTPTKGKPSISTHSAWSNPFVRADDEETLTSSSGNETSVPSGEGGGGGGSGGGGAGGVSAKRRAAVMPLTVLSASFTRRHGSGFTFGSFHEIAETVAKDKKGALLESTTGEQVLLCWGHRSQFPCSVMNAVDAALQLQSTLTSLMGLDEVSVHIGVASGMGERLDFGGGGRLVGAPFAHAEALRDLAVALDTAAVIDGDCARCTRHTHLSRPADIVVLPSDSGCTAPPATAVGGGGEAPPCIAHELVRAFGPGEQSDHAGGEWLYEVEKRESEASAAFSGYNHAFALLMSGRFASADDALQAHIRANPADHVAAKFRERLRRSMSALRSSPITTSDQQLRRIARRCNPAWSL